jgi:hypothetical protein
MSIRYPMAEDPIGKFVGKFKSDKGIRVPIHRCQDDKTRGNPTRSSGRTCRWLIVRMFGVTKTSVTPETTKDWVHCVDNIRELMVADVLSLKFELGSELQCIKAPCRLLS